MDFHAFELEEPKESPRSPDVALSPTASARPSADGSFENEPAVVNGVSNVNLSGKSPSSGPASPEKGGSASGVELVPLPAAALKPANGIKPAGGLEKGKLVGVEDRAIGRVRGDTYRRYLLAWGPMYFLPIMMLTSMVIERTVSVRFGIP